MKDAFDLPLKFFYARLNECAGIEEWKAGEDQTSAVLKNALKAIK